VAAASPLESLLRRDRLVVIAALGAVIVACWAYLLAGAATGMSAFEMTAMTAAPPARMAETDGAGSGMSDGGMSDRDMPGMAVGEGASDAMDDMAAAGGEMPGTTTSEGGSEAMRDMAMAAMAPTAWTPGYAVLMLFMWWTMMMAMMLPSATPMILLFATVNRKQREKGAPYVPTGIFTSGYALVWGAFSLLAVTAQWGLERSGLLSSMMASTNVMLGAGLLIAAGIYQLTPLKHACLRHCRSPIFFITHHWRPGDLGALRMGVEHGAFCTGCCWFLMALLFYGGIMNLYWIVGLAVFVLLEKTIPAGHWLGGLTGLLLIAWGATLLVAAG
jgi:predicted metal-binding membrane protein